MKKINIDQLYEESVDQIKKYLPDDIKHKRKTLDEFQFAKYEKPVGMDYKEESGILDFTTQVLENVSLVDAKIERYLGQFVQDDKSQIRVKYGKGITQTRYDELHEGWYENDEPNGYGRQI